MNYQKFYQALFAPLEAQIGPIDPNTLSSIVGFDCGGPVNLCTIGAGNDAALVTYVSCELAVREEQRPTRRGGDRYELLTSCGSESWARRVLTKLGEMSMEVEFGEGHTVDVGTLANLPRLPNDRGEIATIQTILLHREVLIEYDGARYGVLRCVGIMRSELELARNEGTPVLVERLKQAGVWPNTIAGRPSVA